MTWFHAKEDRPTPKEVYNWRLYLETAIIATGSILYATLLMLPSLSLRTVTDSMIDTALDMTLPLSGRPLPGRASRRPLTLARARLRTFPATSPLPSRLALFSAPSSATYVRGHFLLNSHVMSCLTWGFSDGASWTQMGSTSQRRRLSSRRHPHGRSYPPVILHMSVNPSYSSLSSKQNSSLRAGNTDMVKTRRCRSSSHRSGMRRHHGNRAQLHCRTVRRVHPRHPHRPL